MNQNYEKTLAELGLTEREIESINQMAQEKELTPLQVVRGAVRSYQLVHYGLFKLKSQIPPVGCGSCE